MAEDAVGVKMLGLLSAVLLLISAPASADRGIANIRVTPATSFEPAKSWSNVIPTIVS